MNRKYVDSKTQFAWRNAPFGQIRKVPPFEGERWPIYQRKLIKTTKRRDWTHDEDEQLDALLDEGLSYNEIARRLGRASGDAVRTHLKRRRILALTKRYATLTARQVADLLGKRCSKSVAYWIEQGYLKAREANSGRKDGRSIWRIAWNGLIAFLREPSYWMAWDVERVTDADLRAELAALRASGPRWLSIGDVARRFSVVTNTVGQWISKGWLCAVRYGNWWIDARKLDGWVPPTERKRARPKYAAPTDDPDWIDLRTVAARCNVDRMTPQRWIRKGKLPATRTRKCYWVRECDLEAFRAKRKAA